MENQLSALNIIVIFISYVIMFFLSAFVLWYISKKQKLKRQDFKTSFLVIGITFVVGFILLLPYQLGITFPIIVRVLISIFTLVLTPFLIKKFYKVDWWKAIKVFILMMAITFLIMMMVFFIIGFLVVILRSFF